MDYLELTTIKASIEAELPAISLLPIKERESKARVYMTVCTEINSWVKMALYKMRNNFDIHEEAHLEK